VIGQCCILVTQQDTIGQRCNYATTTHARNNAHATIITLIRKVTSYAILRVTSWYIMITYCLDLLYACTDWLLYIDCKIKLLQNGTTVLNQRVLQRSEACTKEVFLWTLVFWLLSQIKVRDGIILSFMTGERTDPHSNKRCEVYLCIGMTMHSSS